MGLSAFQKPIRWITVLFALLAFIVVPFSLMGTATESTAIRMLAGNEHSWLAGLVVTILLSLDAFLPIPSSAVSTMAGGLLGVTSGTAVSFLGMTLSCAIGWWFGASVGKPGVDFVLGRRESDRLRRFFDRFGLIALVICRPVPVAAEASIILGGASGAPFGRLLASTTLANFGISLGYAAVGAYAWTTNSLLLAFAGAVFVPLVAFLAYQVVVSRMIGRRDGRF